MHGEFPKIKMEKIPGEPEPVPLEADISSLFADMSKFDPSKRNDEYGDSCANISGFDVHGIDEIVDEIDISNCCMDLTSVQDFTLGETHSSSYDSTFVPKAIARLDVFGDNCGQQQRKYCDETKKSTKQPVPVMATVLRKETIDGKTNARTTSSNRRGTKRARRTKLPRYVVQAANGSQRFGVKLKLCGRNVRIGSNYVDPDSAARVASAARRYIRMDPRHRFYVVDEASEVSNTCTVYMMGVAVKRNVYEVLCDFVRVSNAKYAWKHVPKSIDATLSKAKPTKNAVTTKRVVARRRRVEIDSSTTKDNAQHLKKKQKIEKAMTTFAAASTLNQLLRLVDEDSNISEPSKRLIRECQNHIKTLLAVTRRVVE